MDDEALTKKVLDDFENAPISDKLKSALRLLEKLMRDPDAVGAEDVRATLSAGVSREAIRDMFYVGYLFSVYTRLADTLGWPLLSEKALNGSANRLFTRGYR